ncbi:hypothetical protein FHK92_22540 [Pseudomonas brassicacearum subsp. neoaurantiaca]|uniref:Uncharacterized protein n=1 Tax=Pseudomonas brassicacearum subsp. neoaurantiaca TaxID=494916 RepID=A0A7V8UFD4_9PSED|nr:hypothetical protein [Pseudomonas brassicacearum subsp. neoaurantiaca]
MDRRRTCAQATTQKPVGASLLAKTESQPTPSLTVTPLSRAGSLPQVLRQSGSSTYSRKP